MFEKNEQLSSVILNEGLERLEGPDDKRGRTFSDTYVQRITLPSTLKVLDRDTFQNCKMLKCVMFREGSALEEIGIGCFSSSGIEEMAIPKGVTSICESAFSSCKALKKVAF